jgi:RimJ/RimL family protein N-acetyltransferase
MTSADLAQVTTWLRQPHVARWWASGTTIEAQVDKYRRRVAQEDTATVMLVVTEDGRPVGWCQWYRWDRHPEAADATGALPGEVGIDYAIGEPGAIGRGLGTEMIAVLVAEVRRHHPGAGVLVDPDAANQASRRVLEANGFNLVAVRPVEGEPTTGPMAIYRLPGHPASDTEGQSPRPMLLVDAANVMGSRPDGWWRDRPAAAKRLVEQLRASLVSGHLDPPVVVVVEGAARPGIQEGDAAGVRVVHAAGNGDDLLVELATAALPTPAVLVSADRELRRRVAAVGGTSVGPSWLYRHLEGRDDST